jgi:hypothetical protein
MPVTNTLSYLASLTVTKEKSFITFPPGRRALPDPVNDGALAAGGRHRGVGLRILLHPDVQLQKLRTRQVTQSAKGQGHRLGRAARF